MPEAAEGTSYVRGAGGVAVDSRRIVDILGAVLTLILVGLTIYLFVATAGHNANSDRLRRSGVPVQATVTGCAAIGDGVGMGIEYWDCTASFTLNGRNYSAVVNGSRTQQPTGQVLNALVVPGDPKSLSLPGVATRSARSSYVPAITMAAVTAAWSLAAAWFVRRRRAAAPR